MPRVVIGVPMYRSEQLVVDALETLLAQSYRDFAVVAVDDCSPDTTYDVAVARFGDDSRVTIEANATRLFSATTGIACWSGDRAAPGLRVLRPVIRQRRSRAGVAGGGGADARPESGCGTRVQPGGRDRRRRSHATAGTRDRRAAVRAPPTGCRRSSEENATSECSSVSSAWRRCAVPEANPA